MAMMDTALSIHCVYSMHNDLDRWLKLRMCVPSFGGTSPRSPPDQDRQGCIRDHASIDHE